MKTKIVRHYHFSDYECYLDDIRVGKGSDASDFVVRTLEEKRKGEHWPTVEEAYRNQIRWLKRAIKDGGSLRDTSPCSSALVKVVEAQKTLKYHDRTK